jgi:hypothetical protein
MSPQPQSSSLTLRAYDEGNETAENETTTLLPHAPSPSSPLVGRVTNLSVRELGLGRASYGATASLIDDSNNSNRRGTRGNGSGDIVVETVSSSDSTLEGQPDSPASASDGTSLDSPLSTGTSGTGNEQDGQVGEEEESTDGADETRDSAIGTLTRRLRCLFATITWPIVPLGTIVALALLWVLYAASSLDLRKSCSHPLHWYALASLILVAYIPHHAQVRSHLFHYSRERDGPIRPARVRMYDQFFHTVCLLYVYTGVTVIQTCREDLVNNGTEEDVGGDEMALATDGPVNSCQATCPNLYQALSVYVATLEMFTFALILPLLFLPCIYLWFLRRATAEAEAFAQLQDRLQEEEALLSNGGVTAGEILDSLENVKLVSRTSRRNSSNVGGSAETITLSSRSSDEDEVWLIPYSATDVSIGMKSDVRECCICMSDFPVHDEADLEDGLFDDRGNSNGRCQHRTARRRNSSDEEVNDGRANDPGDSDDDASFNDKKETGIVRTRCGHIFHKECLAGWVGGRWQLNPSSNSGSEETNIQDRRKRRARQTCCPLCREDLRPCTDI